MRVAVTGGRGKLGRAVVAGALATGHTVVDIDRAGTEPVDPTPDGCTPVSTDVTDYAQLIEAMRGCDALVHLAAIPNPHTDPAHVVHNNNVTASYNALCAAVELGIGKVVLASSVNAIGGYYSSDPGYEYLPVDEEHPGHPEDAYSLSKLIAEYQADSIAREHPGMTIASLRIHALLHEPPNGGTWWRRTPEHDAKHLWGYTVMDAAVRAFLLVLRADFTGHERFYIVAPRTSLAVPSAELADRFFPGVPLREPLSGDAGFFDCRKAERLLGWRHDDSPATAEAAGPS